MIRPLWPKMPQIPGSLLPFWPCEHRTLRGILNSQRWTVSNSIPTKIKLAQTNNQTSCQASAATSFRLLWPFTSVACSTSSSATGVGFHTLSLSGGSSGTGAALGGASGFGLRPSRGARRGARRGRGRGVVGAPPGLARCAMIPWPNSASDNYTTFGVPLPHQHSQISESFEVAGGK